jgi:phage tail-like protein
MTRADPLLAYQFSVEVSQDPFGVLPFLIPIKGYFTEVTGLDREWETAEYKYTNILGIPDSNFVPMRPSYSPITLKRGITDSETFWLWHELITFGAKPMLKAYVTITLYNRNYLPVAGWSVMGAWPSKITGPQTRAESSDYVIEELTLVHTGVTRMLMDPVLDAIRTTIELMAG